MIRFSRAMDRVSVGIGRLVGWLCLLMVLVGSYNAIVRYLGRYVGANLSSNAYIELQWYLFSLVFLFGAGYTLRRDRHVRVDVVYGRYSPRTRAWVNLLGGVFLLVPFVAYSIWVSWPSVANSWAVREVSADPGGLPRYPIKAALLVAFVFLLLQGVSEIVKAARFLRSDGEGGREAEKGEGCEDAETSTAPSTASGGGV